MDVSFLASKIVTVTVCTGVHTCNNKMFSIFFCKPTTVRGSSTVYTVPIYAEYIHVLVVCTVVQQCVCETFKKKRDFKNIKTGVLLVEF